MAGPSLTWLQAGMPDLSAQGIGLPPPQGPIAINLGGASMPAAPPASPAPVAGQPPAAAPAPAPVAAAPAPPPASAAAPTAAPAPAPMPPDVQFVRVGGGVVPAREAPTRGPKQDALLMASFEPQRAAANAIEDRTVNQALNEQAVYQEQADRALAREEAAIATRQKRSDELAALETDYRNTIAEVGKLHLDDNRWWASKSTGDKIATGILAFIGGLGALGNGGQNLAWEGIKREMDADIEAQKFDYQTTMDRAKGAQNVYAMAMERYGSEDAATAVARAAALEYAQAKVGQLQGQWKGVDAMNAADDLRGRIDAELNKTAASGFKYIPATQQASRYAMMVRGQMLPGTVGEAEAQKYTLEHGVKPAERVDEEMVKGGIQAATERAKGGNEREKRTNDETRAISNQLQQAGVPQARAAAEKALAALNKSEGGKVESAARWFLGDGSVSRAVMPDDANAREQAYANFSNAAIKAMMGNATEAEVDRARAALGTASDPAARRRAITDALNVLDQIEKNAKAGASPEAQAEFDRRRQNAEGSPPLIPETADKGWKK